ncbi:MAG: hypothetical protein NTX28_12935 [Novosphingobium sp.]|nr:hypothetical protein [Novosphingobium sp.]
MFHTSALTALATVCALLAAMPLAAQAVPGAPGAPGAPAVAIDSDVLVERTVKDANGTSRTERVAADRVVPGDRLVFRTSFRNDAAKDARDFVITNPLHPAVQLAPDAIDDLIVSVDKGRTWGRLSGLEVPAPDGGMRPATRDDVTHIRWTLGIVAPGQTGERSFAAIVR